MKVLFAGRDVIFQIMAFYFNSHNKAPRIAELGVLRGANAEVMFKQMNPAKMYLVDSWSAKTFELAKQTAVDKSWVASHDDPKVIRYYGGPLDDQRTYDSLYAETLARFEDQSTVEVIRGDTHHAFKVLKNKEQSNLDLIYLDANHEYETVFWELMNYQSLLSDIGCFQLNDCCHSEKGLEQNLGVLEAVVKFCKSSDFRPALLTNTDWSDVLLVRPNSPVLRSVDQIVETSNVRFVEIPDSLLGAAKITGHVNRALTFI